MARVEKSANKANIPAKKEQEIKKKPDPAKNSSVFGAKPRKAVVTDSGRYVLIDKNGKKHYFSQDNSELNESYFWKAEHDVKNSKAYGADYHKKCKISGSKSGRYYIISSKDKQRHYFSPDGKELSQEYWLKAENAYIGSKGSMARHLTTGEKMKAVGSGLLKTVTSWFTDDKGKFSWKQTLKTVAVGAAIVAATAVAVAALPVVLAAAGITLSAAAAGTLVTAAVGAYGVYQAGKEVAHGYQQTKNANSSKEAYDGVENASKGVGDGVLAVVGARGMKKGVSSVSKSADLAVDAAKMTGKTKFGASVSGMKAGLKTAAEQTVSGAKNTVKTTKNVKDIVAHPVKTVKAVQESAANGVKSYLETRKVKAKIKDAKTKEDYASLKEDVRSNEKLSARSKDKITKKLDKKAQKADDADLKSLYKNTKREHVSKKYGESVKAKYENAVKNSQSIEQLNKLKKALSKDDPMVSTIDSRIKILKEEALKEFNKKVNAENNLSRKSGILRRGKTREQQLLNEAETKFKGDKEAIEKAQNAVEDRAALMQEIDELGKHPSYEEYKDVLSKVQDGDAYVLNILKKKVKQDRFINGRDITKAQKAEIRGEIYRKLNNKSEAYNAAAREMNAEEFNDARNEFEAGKQNVRDNQSDLAIADDRISSAKGHKKVAEAKYNKAQEELAAIERKAKLDELQNRIQGEKESLQGEYADVLEGYKAQELAAQERLNFATSELERVTSEMDAYKPNVPNNVRAPFEKLVEQVATELKKNGKYKYKTVEALRNQAREELLSGKRVKNIKQQQVVNNYKNVANSDKKAYIESQKQNIELEKQNIREAQADYDAAATNRHRTENEIETANQTIKESESSYDYWSKKVSEAKKKLSDAKSIYYNESERVALLELNKEVSAQELAGLKQNLLELKKNFDDAKFNMEDVANQSAKEVVKYMSSKLPKTAKPMHYISGVPFAKSVSNGISSMSFNNQNASAANVNTVNNDDELAYVEEATDKTNENDSELKTVADDNSASNSTELAESTESADSSVSTSATASTDPVATTVSTPATASTDPVATTVSTPATASTDPAATTVSTPATASTDPAATTVSTPATASTDPAATTVSTPATASTDPAATTVSNSATASTDPAATTLSTSYSALTGLPESSELLDSQIEKPKLSDWDVLDMTVQLQNARTPEELNNVINQFNTFDFSNFNRMEAFQRLLKSKQEQIEIKQIQIFDDPSNFIDVTDDKDLKTHNIDFGDFA